MLDSALKICDTLGIREVILTCDKLNIASSKVIKNCKGELVEEFYSDTFKEDIKNISSRDRKNLIKTGE